MVGPKNRRQKRRFVNSMGCGASGLNNDKIEPRNQRYLNSYQPPVLTAFIAPNRESLTCLMRGQCASHRSKGFRTALRRCNTLLEQESPTSVQPAPAVEILLNLYGHACEGGIQMRGYLRIVSGRIMDIACRRRTDRNMTRFCSR